MTQRRWVARWVFPVASIAALVGAAACEYNLERVTAGPPPFDSIPQIAPAYQLNAAGSGGQWDILLTAQMHNTTSIARQLTLRAACPVGLLVFSNPNATGAAAWDSRLQAGGCGLQTEISAIMPGDSLFVPGPHTNTNQILAHYGSVPVNPPGTYYFFAVFPTSAARSGEDTAFVGSRLLQ